MVHCSNEQIPNEVYMNLRVYSGLSAKTNEATAIGLKNTLHFTCLKDNEGNYIGMGRVIGDGGTACQVVDICVLPQWRGKGLSKIIMEDIMVFINNELPASCYISLVADGKACDLYKKYGFEDTLPLSRGMAMKR